MNKKTIGMNRIIVCFFFLVLFTFFLTSLFSAVSTGEGKESKSDLEEIEKNVKNWMKAGKMPGLTLVIIRDYQSVFIKGYGYADLETKRPVDDETLFELGSCSKSFTALAALQLEEKGLINLDYPVSDYLPWFFVKYSNQECSITIRQLLHHTSGIPWETLSRIPQTNSKGALEQTVRNIAGIELNNMPGKQYKYASINYDIVGAVIEKVSGKSYEEYMEDYVFTPLGLTHTSVGNEKKEPFMASGYKRGFFQPRKYDPPFFRGNNPAAYIVSNGKDIARWLRFHMGLIETDFNSLIQKSHLPDLTVDPSRNLASYAMGWIVHQFKSSQIFHSGANPNFTAYIGFNPKKKIGAAVLSNCNSPFTSFIGHSVMKLLNGENVTDQPPSASKTDIFCSILSFVLGFYLLSMLIVILIRIISCFRGKNDFTPITWKKITRLIGALLAYIPFLYGIYLLPRALANVTWETALVWAPVSLEVFVLLILSCFAASYIQLFLSLIIPTKNKYKNEIPLMIVLGILSGLAGTALLFIITTSFFSTIALKFLLYYFILAFSIDVFGKKIVQTKMIKIANNIALDLRIDLINKIFATKYQRFEKIQDGRIFTTLNGDTTVLAGSAGLAISFVTATITSISCFIYMATISVISTLVVIAVVAILVFYYRVVSKKTRVYMEEARDTQNVYMSLLNGLIQGYKELSIHRSKKYEFREDLVNSSKKNCEKSITAAIKFLNANLIGNSFSLIILGILSIVISRLVSGENAATLISFVMVILYLLGPLRIVLNSIPALTGLKVSWNRIKEFVKDLDVQGNQDSVKQFIRNIDLPKNKDSIDITEFPPNGKVVENLKVKGLMFEYEPIDEDQEKGFSVGPIDFEMKKGEILFIVGGNGSGKTTLAKLITGLYFSEGGNIKINDVEVNDTQIGEYFTTVFSNYHIFQKLYSIDLEKKKSDAQMYLKLLNLDKKLEIKDGSYSTLNLSGGQMKRVALLQCYLEDRQIFLFDELAANQDPEFRKFFYRELLKELKEKGKIVIAITHDDHYFDVADKILKMDMGKIDFLKTQSNQNIINIDKNLERLN